MSLNYYFFIILVKVIVDNCGFIFELKPQLTTAALFLTKAVIGNCSFFFELKSQLSIAASFLN